MANDIRTTLAMHRYEEQILTSLSEFTLIPTISIPHFAIIHTRTLHHPTSTILQVISHAAPT